MAEVMALAQASAGALPYLCLLMMVWLLGARARRDKAGAMMNGALAWSLLVWLASYVPSWLRCLEGWLLAIVWGSVALCLAHGLWRAGAWQAMRRAIRLPRGFGWGIVLIAGGTFFAASLYPPNIHDVLTYHMPRVMHWLANRSMEPWPTAIDRQIGMAPFNAMAAMQSVAICGLDIYVNLGQWLAFTGCVGVVAKLAPLLGGGRQAGFLAAFFVATLPAAIIQASNMDSCLIVSFFICVAVCKYLAWQKAGCQSLALIVQFGVALGFAILAKGSAYPIMLPFVALVAWQALGRSRQRLLGVLAAAACVIAINLPHFYYTFLGTGSLVGSAEGNILTRPTVGTFAANLLYNFLVNFPPLLAGKGLDIFTAISSWLGVEGGNARLLPWGGLEGVKPYFAPIDGIAANPLQTLLIMAAGLAVCLGKFRPPWRYALATGCSCVLFLLFLTWHPWMTRIQLPLFMLLAPVCGLWASGIHSRWLARLSLAALLAAALPALFLCVERPLAPASWTAWFRDGVAHFTSGPRERLLFNYAPYEYQSYQQAADALASRKPACVWLDIGANGIEYPVWALLKNRLAEMPAIRHSPEAGGAPAGFIWSKRRHNTETPAALEIIYNHGASQERVYSAAPGEAPQER